MDIAELETFFRDTTLPPTPFKLNEATTITDFQLFLHSHFEPLKANPDAMVNQPLLWRLEALKAILSGIQ